MSWVIKGIVVAMLALVVVTLLTDLAIAYVKPTQGCRITSTIDGDTVRLSCPEQDRIAGRLMGFDTPEFKSRCLTEKLNAIAASYYLRWVLIRAGEITVDRQGTDRYDRALINVLVDGTPVAEPMIQSGLARAYQGGRRQGWCG